jgi:hypothetical protein
MIKYEKQEYPLIFEIYLMKVRQYLFNLIHQSLSSEDSSSESQVTYRLLWKTEVY